MLHQGKGEKALTFCCLGKRRLGRRWAGEQGDPKTLYNAEAVLSSLEHKTLCAAAGKEAKTPSEPHARRCAPSTTRSPQRLSAPVPSSFQGESSPEAPHTQFSRGNAIADKPSAWRTTVPAMPSQDAVPPLLGGPLHATGPPRGAVPHPWGSSQLRHIPVWEQREEAPRPLPLLQRVLSKNTAKHVY